MGGLPTKPRKKPPFRRAISLTVANLIYKY
jgi:hypothetical protein